MVELLSVPSTFAGHTRSEQWQFFLHSVWMVVPALLVLFPAALSWHPRGIVLASPWASLLSHVASLAHWSDYKPGGTVQKVDVALALAVMLTAFSDGWAVLGLVALPLGERWFLWAMSAALALLAALDVRHRQLFGTTHVAGTVIHHTLRHVGYYYVLFVCGEPAGGPQARALLLAGPIAHVVLCAASGSRWLRLDERSAPASVGECAAGLALSYGAVATTLSLTRTIR